MRFRGQALHVGGLSEIVIEPAPEDYGIRFSYDDAQAKQVATSFRYYDDNTTSVYSEDFKFLCVEHVTSALYGLGISNAHIRFVRNCESPIGDGCQVPISLDTLSAKKYR